MVPIILVVMACIFIFVSIKFGNKELSLKRYINTGIRVKIHNEKDISEFKSKLKDINFTDDKLQIGQIRKDVAESLTEIQKQIINLNERIDLVERGTKVNNKNSNIKGVRSKKIDSIIDDEIDIDIQNNISNDEIDIHLDKNQTNNKNTKIKTEFSDTLHSKIISTDANITKKNNDKHNKYDGVINDISLDSKTKRIKKLINDGLKDEEICEKLHVGKGEILLVKGLLNKK